MTFDSGFRVYKKYNDIPPISSGDTTLDELLGGGGFHKDLVYLLYGDKETKRRITNVLLTTAVNAQKSFVNGGFGDRIKVAFVDANNHFNPYNVGKYAVSQHLSPKQVLENIQVARAFTWDQMVELLENKLSKLEHIKVVLISGITTLFHGYEKQTFEDLLKAISGIKKILERTNPLIVITAPLNEYSSFRPKGGKILSHFGNVLILIREGKRNVEYHLVQHPYLAENSLLKWKPKEPKMNLSKALKNTTLDYWI
ncbi:MAG: hypothetical protein ACFFA8_10405 [Promethearchaeota archaeon]